jgi:hypothetical protein
MSAKIAKKIAWPVLALMVVLAAPCRADAEDRKSPYPSMAPIDEYLMSDRAAEIALARSAAPAAISRNAKILVLGRHGYETAVEGKNGFTCVVERAWMSPFDHPEFWNPPCGAPSVSIRRPLDPSFRLR